MIRISIYGKKKKDGTINVNGYEIISRLLLNNYILNQIDDYFNILKDA